MNAYVSQSSNGRNKCYIKINKFYQFWEFHGKINTFSHVDTISLFCQKLFKKTCVISRLFDENHIPTMHICNIYEILIIFSVFEKVDLPKYFDINFRFVNFFLTIYSNLSLLYYIVANFYEYMSFAYFYRQK